MVYDIETFITKVKRWPAFKIDSPSFTSLILSYDMDTAVKDRNYTGEFRDFVIAALYSRNAENIESNVASTITFRVESDEDDQVTLIMWCDFLTSIFSKNFRLELGILSENLLSSPFCIHHNSTDHASRFNDRVKEIILMF